MHEFHCARTLAKVQQRVALAARLVANVTLWPTRIGVRLIFLNICVRLLHLAIRDSSLLQKLSMGLSIVFETNL